MNRKSIIAPLMVAGIALASGGWLLQRGAEGGTNVYYQARLFEEVLRHVSDRFVEEKEPAELYQMALEGMLEELGDPHTSFMSRDEYDQLRIQTQGEYGGLGIEIDVRDGWVTVISPLPGTPAERAGLRAGDRIVEVDGESTRGWDTQEAVVHLRGPRGSKVNIDVMRAGVDEAIPFEIVRDEIHVTSVPAAYMLDDDVGYIELRVFSESSTRELRAAIDSLRGAGMKALVLDLRRNPGGLLDQGISTSDLFLDRGELILETRGRAPNQTHRVSASTGDQFAGMPIAVLTGQYSASASEILAGALQDHDRALLIGETTFGKGSVQTLYPLTAGNWLKLTTARWYTPSGRSIQGPYGIDGERDVEADAPGVPVEEDVEVRREEYRTDSGRTVYGGGGISPDLVIRPDTTTVQEREFARVVEPYGSKFGDALYRFTMNYVSRNPGLERGFQPNAAMLSGFYNALREAGIEVERSTFDAARRMIGERLVYEISYAKWGQEEARRRLNETDSQVMTARELLDNATDPVSLFAAAERYAAAHPQVSQAEVQGAQPVNP